MLNNRPKLAVSPLHTSKKRARHVRLASFAVVGLVAACSRGDLIGGNTKPMDVTTPVTDSFLPQPELLAETPGTLWNLTYMKPGVDLRSYHSIYLEPVVIITSPDSKLAGVPNAQRENLANTFYSDVYTAVSKSCAVAHSDGPGVLRFQIALTDAVSSNGATKTLATYVPYANIAYKATSLAFNGGVGFFSGTATAEAYATDGASNELLWQGVDKRGGNSPAVQNTMDKWLDVHHAFQAWAGQLVTRLKDTGICSPRPGRRSRT